MQKDLRALDKCEREGRRPCSGLGRRDRTGSGAVGAERMLHSAGHAGAAAKVSVVKEIAIGLTLGISLGLVWQNYHW